MRDEPGAVGPNEEQGDGVPAPEAVPDRAPGEIAPAESVDAAAGDGPEASPGSADAPDAAEAADATAEGEAEPAMAVTREGGSGKGFRGRVMSFRIRLPKTRRGLFALLLVGGALAFAFAWTGVTLIHWTETADFCGRCHQMGPELAAYESGPHRDVTCGECHVEPGVSGWIKAKLVGTKQLVQVITGLYPQPVPPPDHDNLPAVQDTCLKCHSLDRLATATLVTRTAFNEDEANSRQFVGLMVRPGSGDVFDVDRSVHWHVLREVDYWSPDEAAAKVDLVEVQQADGGPRQFIAQDRITVTEDVQPDIDAIKSEEKQRRMDCLSCHNRVGHPIPNPRKGLDADLSASRIDPNLPFIKREGMRILWSGYPDEETAFSEIDKLSDFYRLEYPTVASTEQASIDEAEAQMKLLYRLTATPEMKVTASSYPDFLGHIDFPGCFRCHDGGHFLVKDGVATSETIPSTCDTCHTFPQIGPVASLPLGEPPTSHDDSLWVFNHKGEAVSEDPGGQSCGECHAKDYCVNCHSTGAINVTHDEMATNHAEVIRSAGGAQSCTYCHLEVFCARCHAQPMLPATTPVSARPGPAPAGIRWPLVARGPAAGQATP